MWRYCIAIYVKECDDDLYIVEDDEGMYLAHVSHAKQFDTMVDAELYAKNVCKLKKNRYKCKRFSSKKFK